MKAYRWLTPVLLIVALVILSNTPHLRFVDRSALSPEFRAFIAGHTYRFGPPGFFSVVISPDPEYVVRKLGHAGMYGLLGMGLYYATGRSVRAAVALAALVAIGDELHQKVVPGRSGRFADIILDVASAAFTSAYLKCRRTGLRRRSGE